MSLDTLTKPLTSAEIRESIYAFLVSRGIVTTDWMPGAPSRTLIAIFAEVLAAFSVLVAMIARSGFLELSSGEWLTALAHETYGVERIGETFATGNVTLTNVTGAGSFVSVQPGDLVVRKADGTVYRSTAVFTLPAVAAATVTVPVQADVAGRTGTALPSTITSFVTVFVGCSVTNPTALLGTDAETDAALRVRCRAKIGVLSPNGPRDAYTFLATSAKRDDGSAIGITRVRCIPDGIGGVDVYVADADGTVTGTVGDEDTDLGIIDRDIQEQAAPLAITARLHAATPHPTNVAYTAFISDASGLTSERIGDAIAEALAAHLSRIPIGGTPQEDEPESGWVTKASIVAAIAAAPILVIDEEGVERRRILQEFLNNLSVSGSDIPIAYNAAPVLGAATGTITQVSLGYV